MRGKSWVKGEVERTADDDLEIALQYAELEKIVLHKVEEGAVQSQSTKGEEKSDSFIEKEAMQRLRRKASTIHLLSSFYFLEVIKNGDDKALEACLKLNHNVNYVEDGTSVLHCGSARCVYLLLKEEAIDVNVQDSRGWTPLHFASFLGLKEVVTYFVLHPNINLSITNDKGKTAQGVAKSRDVAVLFNAKKSTNFKEKKKLKPGDFKKYAARSTERISARFDRQFAQSLDHLAMADRTKRDKRLTLGYNRLSHQSMPILSTEEKLGKEEKEPNSESFNRELQQSTEPNETTPPKEETNTLEEVKSDSEANEKGETPSLTKPTLVHPKAILEPLSGSSTKRRGRTFLRN